MFLVRVCFLLLYIRLPAELFLIKKMVLYTANTILLMFVLICLTSYTKAICFSHILVILRRTINIKCTE